MQQVLDAVSDYFHDHWIKFLTGVFLMAVGWCLGQWRARSAWQKKEFYNRLNVSLNSLHEGKLVIRTLIEKDCADVFLNSVAVDAVNAAARKTTPEAPILPLSEYWYYLNAVLNELSEHFSAGHLKRDMRLPVTCNTYLICLTSEAAGHLRTRKVRAMILQKNLFDNVQEGPPQFEEPVHSTRWTTLQQLKTEYAKAPHKFLEIEICL